MTLGYGGGELIYGYAGKTFLMALIHEDVSSSFYSF